MAVHEPRAHDAAPEKNVRDVETAPRRSATPAHLGWRLLALVYDAFPLLALLMLASALFLLARGGKPVSGEPLWALLELALLWTLAGLYFVISWQRGGQTLGMRPWRLQVLAGNGRSASMPSLWRRYAVASLSLGLALLWCLFDRDRRGLHDLAGGTVLVRFDA